MKASSRPFHLGTHPELIHLHKELSRRRDKRLELATHKRSFEIENVAKRRRSDEEATWSWWMVSNSANPFLIALIPAILSFHGMSYKQI